MSILKLFMTISVALILSAAAIRADDSGSGMRVREVPAGLSGSLSLSGFIDVAFVADETTTLNDMLRQQSLFSPIPGQDVNLGFVRTSVWMKFALALPPQAKYPGKLLLSLMPNFTDELDVYIGVQKDVMNATDFDRYTMGDHSPRSPFNLNTSANILPVDLLPGQTVVIYLRARNQDASLNVSVDVFSPDNYEYRSIVQNIVRGMWFGGMSILFIIQFFFFYFDRKNFYFILAMDILAVSSTYFGSLGLARLMIFTEGGLGNDYLTSTSSWFGLTAGALSIAGILELRQRYRRLDLYCRFAALTGIIGVLCVFSGVNRYFIIVAGPVILMLTTLAMVVAFVDFARSRDAQHGLNFAAFSLLWAGLVMTNGQRYGIFPLPSWVAGSYAATSIIHFTLLTGSLAVRLRKAEAAAREADRRALQAANNAEWHAHDLVRRRTLELEEARRVAENALQAELQTQEQQVRFMEVISHQYRTPLGVIRTNLESIRLTLPKNDEPNRERLDRARVGITRLVEVLETNLTRSKIQGLVYQPYFLETNVSELVEIATPGTRDLFHGITLNVVLTTEAKIARISADREMLRLAIINLLENAIKFSAPLGSTQVWLDVFCEAGEVHLRVTDHGIGIGNDQVEDLTRNTVRGSNVAHIEGTGAGLSLVKRTTDAHGGRFMLCGRAEGGTEATIVLPSLE
ncbi:7TM diverse intracellular signalling [Rhizobium sp. AN5]|uniref:sensor histidine kinase n=1 Tax=Rhizobium sp. AN5 TaxID=1855304 RepID=UPI000BC618C9|nr:ATP-binding protein [Rhizobium sp. AN5]SOC90472.1 7TM diverse intracellular signalling [Rhizobium sp. AN5]